MYVLWGGVPSGRAIGYEVLAPATAGATAMTTSVFAGTAMVPAGAAIVTVESGSARVRMDGGTPGTAVGHLLVPFDAVGIVGINNLTNFRAARAVAGGEVSLKVSYLR